MELLPGVLAEFTDAELALVYAYGYGSSAVMSRVSMWEINCELRRRNTTFSKVKRELGKRVLGKIRESMGEKKP